MSTDPAFEIRPARPDDEEFVISLLPRLVEFGPPPWRDSDEMTATDSDVLRGRFAELDANDDVAIFIAEDRTGTRLGFIHLHSGTDYFTPEKHGHIADIVVAPAGEGRGVGRALMAKAEHWAREQGFKWLKLGVFAQNQHARKVYEHLGYREDITTYLKELD